MTKSGYWYIVMTIALGVVSIASGNNVLYLIECLLLGGMILSGVISEKAISSIEVALVRRQAIAESGVRDELQLRNKSRLSFFCIEILEWTDGKFVPLALVPKLDPHASASFATPRLFGVRGAYEWQGLGVATAGPFGFARKVRILEGPQRRLVWPAAESARGAESSESARAGSAVADAEVRVFNADDDARSIVWKLSMKGTDLIVRKKQEESPDVILRLDRRCQAGPAFEQLIRQLATAVYRAGGSADCEIRLVVAGRTGTQRISGYKPVLDFLAATQAEGGA